MDDLSKLFEEALREIQAAQRIIIHRHSRPDGDAYGSQLGLYLLVKANFPDKEVYMVGDSNGRQHPPWSEVPCRSMEAEYGTSWPLLSQRHPPRGIPISLKTVPPRSRP